MTNVQLFQHQIDHAKQFGTKPLNMSTTGSGKTYTALQAFKESGCSKLLIICLPSKVADWSEDASHLGVKVNPLLGSPEKRSKTLNSSKGVSISFNSVWRDEANMMKWVDKSTFVIYDEAHKIKSRTSKVSKFAIRLCKKVKYNYLLSATFITNGALEEYYVPLYVANIWRKPWKEFKQMFVIESLVTMGSMKFNQITGYKNEHLLTQMVREASVSFIREKDYTPQFNVIKVKKPTYYNKLKKERMYPQDNGEFRELDTSGSLFNALRSVSSGVLPGVDKVISKEYWERVSDLIESHDEPVIIFYNYNAQLYRLRKLVSSLKRPLSEYNGNLKDTDAFMKKDNAVILCQINSASTGINFLSKSTVSIFLGMPLSSTTYIQALGRTDRANTQGTPIYYILVADTPVEKKIYETVIAGKDFTNKLIEEITK